MEMPWVMEDAAHQQHTDGFARDVTPLKKEPVKVAVVLKTGERSPVIPAEAYEIGV